MYEYDSMKIKKLALTVLTAISTLFAPIADAIAFANSWHSYYDKPKTKWSFSLAPIILWILPPVPPPTPTPSADEPTPMLSVGEIFINKLLVLDSQVGLVQETSSLNFLGGWAYDTRSYLRVTTAAPSNPHFVEGIATNGSGAVHIVDSTIELPPNVRWVGGLPLTPTGQLCVAFG